MALSGSVDFNLNTLSLIKYALRKINVLAVDETPSNEVIVSARDELNMLVKGWMRDRIGLWLIQEATLFLQKDESEYLLGSTGDHCTYSSVQTQAAADAAEGATSITVDSITGIADNYYLGIELDSGTLQWTTVNGTPSGSTIVFDDALTDDVSEDAYVYAYQTKVSRPLGIAAGDVRVRNREGTDRKIYDMPRLRYGELSDKSESGVVANYIYEPLMTNAKLTVWQPPSTIENTLQILLRAPIQDFDANTNDAHFPQEWFDVLVYNLGARLIPNYGLQLTPTRQFVIQEAKKIYEEAKGFDNETGYVELRLNTTNW